jgi:tRNA U38,U39,U40 pseudouridine synthase TruA
MMAILFLIGDKMEKVEAVDWLLDVDTLKERPNYDIAEGNNLILAECGYEHIHWTNFNFYSDLETFQLVDSKL